MINIEKLDFCYNKGEKKCLKDLNIRVKKGELVALVGRSGCGKTSLTRLINGLATKYYEGSSKGCIKLAGKNIEGLALWEIGSQVGSIFQNPKSQFFAELVEDEVAFGVENYGRVDNIEERVVESLDQVNGADLYGKSLFDLSSGERQKVAIASIKAMDPSIYVFDEPSANLDMWSVESIRDLIAGLKDEGKTIVISEHRLYYLKDMVDRYYYLENGEIKKVYSRDEFISLSREELEARGLRNTSLDKLDAGGKVMDGKNKLTIENLDFSYKNKSIFSKLNIDFTSSNVYGLIGKNGRGKTTLAKILSGILRETSGKIYLNDRRLKRKARNSEIYYLSNNADSNLFEISVEEEVKLVFGEDNVVDLLESYNLLDKRDSHPQNLSGGEKQRLTLATTEGLDREVYIFDEPTSGLDGSNMKVVAERIKQLQLKDKIIIIISHDFEFIMESCSRF